MGLGRSRSNNNRDSDDIMTFHVEQDVLRNILMLIDSQLVMIEAWIYQP